MTSTVKRRIIMSGNRNVEIVDRVRNLIERGWTAAGPARSRDGRKVAAQSIEAVQWSLFGALAASTRPFSKPWEDFVGRLVRESGEPSIVALMDWSESQGRTKDEIVALLERVTAKSF